MNSVDSPILIDGLQFCRWSRRILEQMREGGMSAVHVTLAYHQTFRNTVAHLMEWNSRFQAEGDLILFGRDVGDIDRARSTERTAIFFGLQTPMPIEDDLGLIEVLHTLGVRFMQLTYNNQSLLGCGWMEDADGGITRMGRQAVREMNRLGMVIDLSHAGERTTLEAIELSERAIAVTHATPSWWCPSKRGKSREVLRALGARHGMLGLSLYPHHLQAGSDTTLESFCKMAAEAAEVVGSGNLGIGSDLCQDQPDSMLRWMREGRWSRPEGDAPAFPPQPRWFQDNRDFPSLAAGLRGAGFAESEIAGILGENWYRFMRSAFMPARKPEPSTVPVEAQSASPRSATAGFMAMKGAGYYSKATIGARDVINEALPLVTGAIERMQPIDDGSPLRVADFGCADGGTSLEMWRNALAFARRLVPSRSIEIVYTDLPRNDFSQLFRTIHNQTELASYYGQVDRVFPFASGTSFHERIFPDNSLDLAFSATASHYISEIPCAISNHVHMVGAHGKEREAYEEAGRREWDRLLALRAEELSPGGMLVFLNFGIDEQGRYLGHTGGVSMFDTFNRFWRELADEGVIIESEYVNTNFPQVYRTIEEFIAPLKESSSAAYRAGLRLEHVESRHLVCPYAADFARHRNPDKFARAFIPTLRSWSEPTFAAGLSASRPAEQRAAILDEFFARYEKSVASAPEGHGMDYIHVHLVCRKAGR